MDIVYKVTIPEDGKNEGKHSIIRTIANETKTKSDSTPVPQFTFGHNKSNYVEKMSMGKNKNWEKEFDLPVLQTEYYAQDKVTQRVHVPYPSGCGAGDCNAYGLSSGFYIDQKMTNMDEEEKEQLDANMKEKKNVHKEKCAKLIEEHGKWGKGFFDPKPRLENNIPFDHYKQVVPVSNKYVLNKQLHKYYAEPCFHCLQNNGKIWMLRGNGDKAMCKNKGMKRIRQREINDAMRM
jgi:hypothetical protein